MPSPHIKPGLRVLVTAGASGIGRAIAEAFGSSGARIHICDLDEAKIADCRETFPDLGVTRADVSDPQQVSKLFDDIHDSLGGLDVLVNNAGIAGPTLPIEKTPLDEWYRTLNVNLNGTFHCTRLAVPMLAKSDNARLINISSVAGRLGYPLRSAYAATKWGLIGLTKSLAMELGPRGICVNAVLPGIVKGPRMHAVIQARANEQHKSYAEVEHKFLSKVSLRRMVSASDVAAMVLFLCSPAGANISGQSLSVCGNVESLG
jgi:NAD(P)-dependent dehydrogenase (short-subunit alcohol dehydrogenase family)